MPDYSQTPANKWHRQREKQRLIAENYYEDAEELTPEEVREMDEEEEQ